METQSSSGFKRKIVRFFRYIKNNKWESFFYLILFISILCIAFYILNFVRWIKLSRDIENQKNHIANIESTIKQISSTDEFKRYSYAKHIENQIQTTYWYDTIKSLITIFDSLKNVWSWSQDLTLSDFKITSDSIKIWWEVSQMKTIYMSWGLIDKFLWFKFIDTVSIPSYNRKVWSFEFVLDAKIKLNDAVRK